MTHEFIVSGEVIEWRGPAPHHFVVVSDDLAKEIRDQSTEVSYGWGMIPVSCTIGLTIFETSLWSKDGIYFLPLKDKVRTAEGVALGQEVTVSFYLRYPKHG